jgi:uncharacterized membrane protein YidH (DUF202 family)
MLSVLAFITAGFALAAAFVLGRTQPSAVRRLVVIAAVVVLIGVGLAVWGQERWKDCYHVPTGDWRRTGPVLPGGARATERCPDRVLGMRSPL